MVRLLLLADTKERSRYMPEDMCDADGTPDLEVELFGFVPSSLAVRDMYGEFTRDPGFEVT